MATVLRLQSCEALFSTIYDRCSILFIICELCIHVIVFCCCVGLIHIAASVGLTLLAPRKKISVMLIGNHSAGKSSFVNWYLQSNNFISN